MRKLLILAIIFSSISLIVKAKTITVTGYDCKHKDSAVNCEKCNIELLRDVRFNLGSVEDKEILHFFECFNENCFSDIEFSEAANFSLFILLKEAPDRALKIVADNRQDLDFEFILMNLKNPVSEDIDLDGAKKSIMGAKINNQIKKDFISAFE